MQRVRAEDGTAPQDALDADLHRSATEHVQRVRERCPQLAAVNGATFVAVVVAHLTALPADRPWRRWQPRRGEPAWVGGQVGLHVPATRPAA